MRQRDGSISTIECPETENDLLRCQYPTVSQAYDGQDGLADHTERPEPEVRMHQVMTGTVLGNIQLQLGVPTTSLLSQN